MDFSPISHYSIIREICDSDENLPKMKAAFKSNISNEMKEKLAKIGHNNMRSIVWILESCVLECDFAAGRITDKPQGYRFSDLYFNMLSSFDGFKGVELDKHWMPPMDIYCHWSVFNFDASLLRKTFEDMKERSPAQKTHLMLFLISVGLAILAKNPQIRVHRSNWMSLLGAITNQFGEGLLNAFIAVSPRVQDDLDKKAIYCNEFTRTRKIEKVKLPSIGTIFPYNRSQTNPPEERAVDVLPPPPVYYLPETMHPSWHEPLPAAPSPVLLPLTASFAPVPVPSQITPPFSSSFCAWSPTAFQPYPFPSDILILSPTRELPYIPLVGKLRALQPKKPIRRYINRVARDQLISFIQPGDFSVTRKQAAKNIMRRQTEATGSSDTESQIIYLLARLHKERQSAQIDDESP